MLAAATALRTLAERATTELTRRGAAWQELSTHVAGWLEDAQEVEARATTLKAVKAAETWVKGAADDLRAERFAPISERAIENWRELRQGSTVDLHEITLKKSGETGRADFDVRADGEGANALGVMSQGELLALSVSVFLPRAALDESPFRFAVIDDPVQAMDPAKVDGLARVLHRAARTRQIVVFTHDDRLPGGDPAAEARRDDAARRPPRAFRRRRADLAHAGPALPRRRSRLRQAGPAAARSPGARRADVLPQRGRGRRRHDRPPPRGRARHEPRRGRRADRGGADAARDARARAVRRCGPPGRGGHEIKRRYGAGAAGLVSELNRGSHGAVLDAGTLKRLPESTRELIHDLMA